MFIIGITGGTGSGKTTIANQILCLLRPSSGELLLDGQSIKNDQISTWQSFCSYVPQSINLLNTNFMRNIAYGLEDDQIDESKVLESAAAAQLNDLITVSYTHLTLPTKA